MGFLPSKYEGLGKPETTCNTREVREVRQKIRIGRTEMEIVPYCRRQTTTGLAPTCLYDAEPLATSYP